MKKYREVNYEETPNGGVKSVIYYFDLENRPCEKEDASYANIVEYDRHGNRVMGTCGKNC